MKSCLVNNIKTIDRWDVKTMNISAVYDKINLGKAYPPTNLGLQHLDTRTKKVEATTTVEHYYSFNYYHNHNRLKQIKNKLTAAN
jgi:hypothetical protein